MLINNVRGLNMYKTKDHFIPYKTHKTFLKNLSHS